MKAKQQILRTLLVVSSLAGGIHAEAASFKRFWRGYALPALSSDQFVADVNNKIIPATRELFRKNSGLQSYQPVISNMQTTSHSPIVAHEFALLHYESEDAYRKFRATPEGLAYGDLHWEMFDQSTSKSAVVEAYSDTVIPTHAYDLLGQDIDWKRSQSSFSVHTRSSGTSEEDFLKAVKNHLDETRMYGPDYGLQSLIVLVMSDHIAVYEAWDKLSSRAEYHEILASDMPTGEPQLAEVSDTPMDISLHVTSAGFVWPGQGTKIFGR